MCQSLYERVGGAEAIRGAVEGFYDEVLVDPSMRPFFSGRNLARQAAHQLALLSVGLGGCVHRTGRGQEVLEPSRARSLGLTERQLSALPGRSADLLRELGLDPEELGLA